MSKLQLLTKGIIRENPTFVLLLGMCPTLGTTTSAVNGMGMGLATLFVLTLSNVVISLVKNLIPAQVRIPSFIVVIAASLLSYSSVWRPTHRTCTTRWASTFR